MADLFVVSATLDALEENLSSPIAYSVTEAYVPGYMTQISGPNYGSTTETVWKESTRFDGDVTYVLKTNKGCISAESASKETICYVDETTAKESPLALWTATVSGDLVRLTNQAGQTLVFNNDRWCF